MSTIYDKAKDDTLTRIGVKKFGPANLDSPDDKGFTPTAYAVITGSTRSLQSLIDSAKININGKVNRTTLLHLAVASKEKNRIPVLEKLLKAGIDPNEPAEDDPQDTAAIQAVRSGADKEVIEYLRNWPGINFEAENKNGESPHSLARKVGDNGTQEVTAPKEIQGSGRIQQANFIVALVYLMLWYFGNQSKIAGAIEDAVKKICEEQRKPVVDSIWKPITTRPRNFEECKKLFDQIIAELGFEPHLPPGHPLIDELADALEEALKKRENANRPLNEIKDLCRCALYQPIIYCDDSGSMTADNRQPALKAVVHEIANVMNTFAPDGYGAHLRFINRDVSGLDSLNAAAVEANMNYTPAGATPLGTSLHNKILQPFIYDPLSKNTDFTRPFLVITITDGEPNEEDVNKFQNEIIECANRVHINGFNRHTVKFLVSQVGNAQEATQFLDGLSNAAQTPALTGLLHRTADRMDVKYTELQNNRVGLSNWLLSTLNTAIVMKPRP